MPKKYKLIVFDWDGTLSNSIDHIAGCIQKSFREVGLPTPPGRKARHVIGLGLEDAMNYLNPGMSKMLIKKIAVSYKKHFLSSKPAISLFPHVKLGLQKLKKRGFLVAISTGKTKAGLESELINHDLEQFFDATRCADEDKPKPDPAMLQWLTSHLGIKAGETLMVGDTSHDLKMAQQADVDALGVGYGAHPPLKLLALSPIKIVDTSRGMFEWILKNG